MLRAERAERWRHPLRRSTMAGLSLLLAATLAGQVAVHYRDGLAAAWPASRAWLRAVCDRIGCNIEAPMRIDSLAVESSGLVRVDGSDVYQLSLVVRNRAASEVRMPAVDLAVTDPQGQTTARRVLFAAELGQDATSLPAQGELGAMLRARRERDARRFAAQPAGLVFVHEGVGLDVSSTDAREALCQGRDPRYLMPEPVRRMILDEGIYARPGNATG